MIHPVLAPVEQALHGLAGVDLAVIPAVEIGGVVVGLRRLITGFEAEFARFAHAAECGEVWRATGGVDGGVARRGHRRHDEDRS